MRNKIIIITIAVALIMAALVWISSRLLFRESSYKMEATPQAKDSLNAPLGPEVDAVLRRKMTLLIQLLRDPFIVAEVEKSNKIHQDIKLVEILELDRKWRSGDIVFISPFLTNEVALRLLKFQEENSGFSEIFISDAHGLNVGQTNKTTDYYQADEDWWVLAYDSGRGKEHYGSIEFDESSQTEAISIYIPIMSDAAGAIGVSKAVISVAAIKFEL